MEGLIKITPDKERAKSIVKMAETTLEIVRSIDSSQFSSHVTKEYYDVIREFMTATLLLDGYKTYGEGAHKKLIEYFQYYGKGLTEYEISIIDSLRITRNKIEYDGFFVEKGYLERKIKYIHEIIAKLRKIIDKGIES